MGREQPSLWERFFAEEVAETALAAQHKDLAGEERKKQAYRQACFKVRYSAPEGS